MSPTHNTGVKLVIYKKIVEGDLSKFTATSNFSPTGGGARDLRFSPANEFFAAFNRMFSYNNDGTYLCGYFSWHNHAPTEVSIYPPTNARPNEVRISCIHECFPQEVIPESADDCILLIVLDNTGRINPYFTSQYSLQHDNWHPDIKNPILAGLTAPRNRRTTAMGIVDIENGGHYTNGRI